MFLPPKPNICAMVRGMTATNAVTEDERAACERDKRVKMIINSHLLEELGDRLEKAEVTLTRMATEAIGFGDKARLAGKADGVRLAASYLEDTIRLLTHVNVPKNEE